MNPHKRQQRMEERIKREHHKSMRKIQDRCNEFGVQTYIVGEDDDVLVADPNYYICILSKIDTDIHEPYYPGMERESICIESPDYDMYAQFILDE